MVGTRHCCWGECKTDSRYPEKWPESLKELEKSGQKVLISLCKMGLTGLHDSTVRGVCTFAAFFSVSRPLSRFTLVYEGHFVLCYKEKIKPLDRAMANFKRS